MPTTLITGANRGLGLELARQYSREGWTVLATCRDPEKARGLRELRGERPEQVEVHPLEVTDPESIQALSSRLGDVSVDLLLNNAGVRRMDAYHLGSVSSEGFMHSMEVNVLGALKVAEAFLPHLERAPDPLLVMVSSNLGSLGRNNGGGDYSYGPSKAALNHVTRSLAHDLESRGITVVALHPGWVRTDMGGDHARLGVDESVGMIREVLSRVSRDDTGRFLRYDGHEEVW